MSTYGPVLRIEVEGVKHAIVQHLGASAQEFTDIVSEEIERLDIETMVRSEIRRATPAIINDAVREAGEEISKRIARKLVEEIDDQIWDAAIKRATG